MLNVNKFLINDYSVLTHEAREARKKKKKPFKIFNYTISPQRSVKRMKIHQKTQLGSECD